MDPITLGLLIAGGTSLIGSWINSRAQKKANETNVQLARESQQFEREQQTIANTYNAPSAQMLRLQQANLNPNLVYGSGNVTGNQTQAVKATQKRVEPVKFDMPDMASKLQEYIGMKNTMAQTDNVEANTKYVQQKTLNEGIRNATLGYEKNLKWMDVTKGGALMENQIAFQKEIMDYQTQKILQEIQLQKGLNPELITTQKTKNWQQLLDYETNKALRPFSLGLHDKPLFKVPATLINTYSK